MSQLQSLHKHSVMFLNVLKDMEQLHLKKAADYGSSSSPLRNILCSAAENGVHPLVAINIRRSDKKARILSYIEKGHLVNESVYDAYLDEACYDVLAHVVLQLEERGELDAAIREAVNSANKCENEPVHPDHRIPAEREQVDRTGCPEDEVDASSSEEAVSCIESFLDRILAGVFGVPVEGRYEGSGSPYCSGEQSNRRA